MAVPGLLCGWEAAPSATRDGDAKLTGEDAGDDAGLILPAELSCVVPRVVRFFGVDGYLLDCYDHNGLWLFAFKIEEPCRHEFDNCHRGHTVKFRDFCNLRFRPWPEAAII